MQPFSYVDGGTAVAAIRQHAQPASAYLAGGTTLVDLMRLHVMTPRQVIDVTQLPLTAITDRGASVEVGALVTNAEMAHHPLVRDAFPLVSQALLAGASPQIRNVATTAGNLLQRTRCAYFRDSAAKCNKRVPGSGCDALQGFNRMHAILGTSERCIASHPSDLCVALMAVGAVVTVQGAAGTRDIPITDFFSLPGATPQVENALGPDELVLAVALPRQEWFRRSAYVKVRDRSSYAFALVSAAVALDLDGTTVRQARIAFGGLGTVPWRATAAEEALRGKPLTTDTMRAAARAETSGARTTAFNAFKVPLAEQTLVRALGAAAGLPAAGSGAQP